MTTGIFNVLDIDSPIARIDPSAVPPAGHGTINVIGLLGNFPSATLLIETNVIATIHITLINILSLFVKILFII
jgi:hypothetical protein